MKIKLPLLILCALALSLGNGPGEEKPTVRVSLFSWPGYGFWFIAREKDLAPDLQWDIRLIEDPYESYAQMTAGKLDITSSTAEYGPIAAATRSGIKMVAYTNPSTGTDKIIVAPGIERVSDLKGRPVAVLEGGLTQIFMAMWLEKNGLKFDDVKYVNVVMDDAVAAMVSGKVAAGEFWEPFGSQVLKSLPGSKVWATSAEDEWQKTALLGDAMYMATAFLEKRPEIARQAMKAYWDAVAWWKKNPAEGNRIIARGIKFEVSDVEEVIGLGQGAGIYVFDLLEAGKFMGLISGDPPLGLANGQIHQQWALTNEWWVKFGLIPERQPIEGGVSFFPLKDLLLKP